jgi:hypothetical protein
MLLAHVWLIYPLGHVYAEPELEEPMKQAQAEDFNNIVWVKASLSPLNQYSLSFISNLALCSIMIVH